MIKLLIDSSADICQEEADKLGVTLLPIEVRFGDKEYMDGVDLLPSQFYEILKDCKELPKTSQINPFRFEEYFEEATKNGDEAICIVISSGLSGTYLSACQAAEKFEGKVHVIDSLNACIGQRLLAFHALDLIKQGLLAKQIADILNEDKLKLKVMATIDTLKYLKMGGRISALTAFAGEALGIKPIIGVVDGKIKMLDKARGFKKGCLYLMGLAEKMDIDYSKPMGYVWSGSDQTTIKAFKEDSAHLFAEKPGEKEHYIIGSTVGAHIGAGAVGFAFFVK